MSDLVATPIGDFPQDWRVRRLGDVTVKIQDGTHFSPQSTTGPFRYITSKNIRFGTMDVSTCGWISEREHKSIYARCDVQSGDVLLTKDGANTGNAALNTLTEPFSLLSSVALIRSDDHTTHSPFILQYLLSPWGQQRMKDLMAGNAITRLTLEKINDFQVPFPPIHQQRKIARILTTVDNLIEKTEALIAKYQAIKQGMMHDLFTRGLDSRGHLRPTYDEAPELYNESELGWIPKKWELVKCDDICKEIVVGIVIQPAQYYISEGVPVLRSANVRETGIDPSDLVYMSEESNRLLAKSMLHSGDIVTVRTGYPGTSCVVTPEFDGANCVDILISRPGPRIRSAFLSIWINSDYGKNQVLRMQGGLAQQHFNVGELKNLLVALPSSEEQERMESALFAQQAQVYSERAQLLKLKALKTGLMQDLLTGKVRVKVDESEEATDE